MLKQTEFLQSLAARGFKQTTLQYINIHLDKFNLWLTQEIKQVTTATITAYQNYLTEDYRKKNGNKISPLTILAKLSVLKKYFNYLLRQKEILLDPALNIELPKKRDYIPKNILTQIEAEHFLTLPDKSVMGIRDQAILEILYSSAIRRKELCDLDLYDINLKDKTIHIKAPKNRKDRIVPIGNKAKEAAENYLLAGRIKLAKNLKEKAVFLSRTGKRITKETLNYIVKSYADKMRLTKKITPHSLRHSCATHLLQNGSDLKMIQMLLGHTRITTTEIYTRVVPEDLKAAIQKYHPRGKLANKNKLGKKD